MNSAPPDLQPARLTYFLQWAALCLGFWGLDSGIDALFFESNLNYWESFTNQEPFELYFRIGFCSLLTVFYVILERQFREVASLQNQVRSYASHVTNINRLAQVASWEMDLQNGDCRWSPELYDLLQLPPQSLSDLHSFAQHLPESELAYFNSSLAAAMEVGQPLNIEHRFIDPNGEYRLLRQMGKTSSGPDGRQKLLVALIDETRQNNNIYNLKLFERVVESASEAILLTDHQNRIFSANRAFETITGYNLAEVQGKDPKLLGSGRHGKAYFKGMWSSINQTGFWEGEIWDRRKTGEIYPKHLTIFTLRCHLTNRLVHVGMFHDISAQKELEASLQHHAFVDPLTGLPNRIQLHHNMVKLTEVAKRKKFGYAVLFIDLDGFKPINDEFGHQVGDQALLHVGNILQGAVRASDYAARLGGDEFVCVLVGNIDEATLLNLAEGILQKIGTPFLVEQQPLQLGASIGISRFPHHGEEIADLLKKADEAMYQAKRAGKKGIMIWDAKPKEP